MIFVRTEIGTRDLYQTLNHDPTFKMIGEILMSKFLLDEF